MGGKEDEKSTEDMMRVDRGRRDHRNPSTSLPVIIGDLETRDYFDNIWQKSCQFFRYQSGEAELCVSPFNKLIQNGWESLVSLLDEGRLRPRSNPDLAPLIFQDQQPVFHDEQVEGGEQRNLYAEYLRGRSIVLNHADTLDGHIAKFCDDLQGSFPHAYANAYVTPPESQAVPPHADDRDVLVCQVLGTKTWKVYQRVPIPFPYPHQQVGKEGLEVPKEVLEGSLYFGSPIVMRPGDVLYMPRGFVHEASTAEREMSFHVTVALATHDWTYAGIIRDAVTGILEPIVENRMALPVQLGRGESEADRQKLQQRVDNTFQDLKRIITAESICHNLHLRYERHNQRAEHRRQEALDRLERHKNSILPKSPVGPEAANAISLTSFVRPATDKEKASIPQTSSPRGLNVREEIADKIFEILQRLKSNPSRVFCVRDMLSLLEDEGNSSSDLICPLSLLSFAKCCVEFGSLALVP